MHIFNETIFIKTFSTRIFSIMKDISNYSKFMQQVKNIEIIKKNGTEIISKWELDIEGADIVWEEKDTYDEKNKKISFIMLQGDYASYFGEWILEKVKEGTKLFATFNIDWGIPSFEKRLTPTLEQKMKKIIRSMLVAIKLHAENYSKNA